MPLTTAKAKEAAAWLPLTRRLVRPAAGFGLFSVKVSLLSTPLIVAPVLLAKLTARNAWLAPLLTCETRTG